MGTYTDLLNQTITLKVTNGTDENSNPVITQTLSNVPCRIEYKNRLIINAQSQQVTSGAKIFIEKEDIKICDIVTVEGKDYEVLEASPVYDFDNNFDITVVLI